MLEGCCQMIKITWGWNSSRFQTKEEEFLIPMPPISNTYLDPFQSEINLPTTTKNKYENTTGGIWLSNWVPWILTTYVLQRKRKIGHQTSMFEDVLKVMCSWYLTVETIESWPEWSDIINSSNLPMHSANDNKTISTTSAFVKTGKNSSPLHMHGIFTPSSKEFKIICLPIHPTNKGKCRTLMESLPSTKKDH